MINSARFQKKIILLFFERSKDNYVAQTFIFNEVQKVLLKVLFFIIAVFLEKRLLFSAVVYALLGVLSN
jgi:F0F1-type ATP synthase assembly protein I